MKNPLNLLVPRGRGLSKVRIGDLPYTWTWFRRLLFDDHFIIEIPHGGIGDHLFLSQLPELLIKHGHCRSVSISTHSRYNFPDLYDLFWAHNPYVAGVHPRHGWRNSGLRPQGTNFLDGIVYQFTTTKPRPGSTHPVIYNPERFKTYAHEQYYLIDFNRISNKHALDPELMRTHLENTIRSGTDPINMIYVYKSTLFDEIYSQSSFLKELANAQLLTIVGREKNLHDYFSRIKHSRHFFHLYSGGAVVASAFNVPTTVYCEFKDSAISFDNQTYITVPLKKHR